MFNFNFLSNLKEENKYDWMKQCEILVNKLLEQNNEA